VDQVAESFEKHLGRGARTLQAIPSLARPFCWELKFFTALKGVIAGKRGLFREFPGRV
jgi:hypothetical protein